MHQYLATIGDTYWVQKQNTSTALSGTSVTINDTAPTTDRYNLSICEILPPSGGTQTWNVSGTISPSSGGSGATVTLSGPASATVTADGSGNYSFSGLSNGTFTVTPSKSGYTFSPASQSATVNGANVSGINFTAQVVPTWSISGTISPASGGSGATVTLSGSASATVTADSSGNYSFNGLGNGTYTVTPSKSGYTFTPSNQSATINGANVSGINFTAQAVIPTGIYVVQENVNGNVASVPAISATFSSSNTAGNFLIVVGTAARPNGTIAISDTAGNTYIPAIGPVTDSAQDVTAYIWYVPSAMGGANTVTLTPTSPRALEIHISEWSGLSTISPLDQTASATGVGTNASSGFKTPAVDGELIFGYTFLFSTATAGTGFTSLSLVDGDLDEYEIQPAASSVAATFTQTSGTWFALMATFKPAGSEPPPDFTLAATPTSQTVNPGGSQGYTVTVGALNGFADTVNLSVAGLPAAASALFTPASVTGAGSVTLGVTTTAGTPLGSSTLTITGTTGTITHTAPVTFVVSAPPPPPDFTLSVSPNSQTTSPNGTTSYTVTVAALNGFAGNVAFGVTGLPAGAAPLFTPASVTGSGSTTLQVTTTSTPAGSSTLTITGTSGSIAHSIPVGLVVSAPPVGAALSIDFVGNATAMGSTESAGVVAKSQWNSASGASRSTPLALVDETGAATSATVTWTADNVWSTGIANTAGNLRLMKGYLDTGNLHPTTVTVAGLTATSYDVYVYVDGDNASATRTGSYQISGSGIMTTVVTLTDAANTNFTGTFTQANNSSGNYVKFSINATGFTLTATPGTASDGSKRAPVNGIQIIPTAPPPDFTLAATPASQTVNPGGSPGYTVTVGALNGFANTVNLSVAGLPAATSAQFTPTTVTGAGSATLGVTTTAGTLPGSSTLTITGTTGTITHTASVALVVTSVPNVSISGTISPLPDGAGASVNLGGAAIATTTTSGSGTYSFMGLMGGTYAVMPSKPGYAFTPSSRALTIAADTGGVDFTAAPAHSISGTITPASSGAATTVALSGGSFNATTTADGTGAYTFAGLADGTYTLTPSKTSYGFTPSSQMVTLSGADQTGVNFTAALSSGVLFFDDFTGTTLDPAWTVISRHGEYAQGETECNTSQQVSVANGYLTISTAAQPTTCGDFNVDGTVRHAPQSWPYVTGDIQWKNLNFTYGTVEIRAKFPDKNTGLWPATWLLGSNCQVTNPFTADTGYSTCANIGSSGYTEIDMTECYGGSWCQFHIANPSFGSNGTGCDLFYKNPVDTNWHTFTTVWSSTNIKQYMDGVLQTSCNQSLNNPMFLIIQIQTGGAGGTPNNSLLPATLLIDYVKVTQP